jgi:SAM-dependent methyltransferase
MDATEIRRWLDELRPDIPWAHYFNLAGVETITKEQDEKFYEKALGLQRIGEIALEVARTNTRRGTVAGNRVLDIACAEGAHSILLARAGAEEVLGLEGRELYVRRASFVASAAGVGNVRFLLADVRKLEQLDIGTFDFVLASGILHHLGPDSFVPFLRALGKVARDTLLMYTHVCNADSIARFRLQPGDAVGDRYEGALFREHDETASTEQRIEKVRAALDETFSFWATEPSLVKALQQEAGFHSIYKLLEPHVFSSDQDRSMRILLVARK